MGETTIGLADAIENLRQELTEATRQGQDQRLRFKIDDIELELAVAIVREGGGEGKLSFKVLGSGAEVAGKGRFGQNDIHRIKLSLKLAGDPDDPNNWVRDTVSDRPK
jgi:hypothetical protein